MTDNGMDMIRLRIVAARLFRYMPNLVIEFSSNSFFDLLATDKTDDFSFGVKVGSSSMFRNKTYNEDFDEFEKLDVSQINVPVIAAIADIDSENVKIGIVTKIRLGEIKLFRSPTMVTLNEGNARILYDNIKSMDNVIRVLKNDNIGIIKDYTIIPSTQNNISPCAHLIYRRQFREGYRMVRKQVTDDKEKFQLYAFGVPQDWYPEDEFDRYVMRGIQETWQDANITLHNDMLIFNTELDSLRNRIISYVPKRDFILQIEPEIDENFLTKYEIFTALIFGFELYPEPIYQNYWTDTHTILSINLENWQNLYTQVKNEFPYQNPSQLLQL